MSIRFDFLASFLVGWKLLPAIVPCTVPRVTHNQIGELAIGEQQQVVISPDISN